MIEEIKQAPMANSGVFDLKKIAANFPETADTMLIDTRLTNEDHASARVFRVYHPAPAHYHATCDEYLMVISGRATFFLGEAPPFEVGPGQLIFFKQGTIHGTPEILEEPFLVLAVDTPRRDPADVIFVNPSDGTPDSFIQSKRLY
ncbi:cupin domain-containing protein [Tunturiibacter lichenicola]|jgi:mannose-6-phosphate isomerase-like protein (cupin superfamily)|uniref:cupin domain-containing protein n=1 Tax=Tunturiibacter lichenicola TaxID=2051959 RepID=UPI003D9B1199